MSLSVQTPNCKLDSLTFPPEVSAEITALLEEFEFEEAFQEYGIPCRRKILLHGPSGCGKTSIAHALAAALEMKICVVGGAEHWESPGMGQAENKVKETFIFAAQNRIVVLIDEFDSLAAARHQAETGADKANNRVVNTFLMEMERQRPLGMVIAATNFLSHIDKAILRRFDLILEIPEISHEGLKEVARRALNGRFGIQPEAVLKVATTPAAVVKAAHDMVRRKVIELERKKREDTMPLFGEPKDKARQIREKLEATP
jgi:SpoVK/Ycf46/Vps4 family AAA+-type ATPase